MNELNGRERELVALGSAMGSNCISCIEYHIPEARKAGLTDSQISEAIRLADEVRQAPARKVLNTAQRMLPGVTVLGTSNAVETTQAAARSRACCG